MRTALALLVCIRLIVLLALAWYAAVMFHLAQDLRDQLANRRGFG